MIHLLHVFSQMCDIWGELFLKIFDQIIAQFFNVVELTSFIIISPLKFTLFKLAPKTFITIFVHFHSMQMCHTLNNHYTLKQLFIVLYIVLLGNPPMHCKFFVLLQKLTFLLIYYDNNIWIKDNWMFQNSWNQINPWKYMY